MVWGSRESKVDVCILHQSVMWCSPKLFSSCFIFEPNESHEGLGKEKKISEKRSQQNYCVSARLLF